MDSTTPSPARMRSCSGLAQSAASPVVLALVVSVAMMIVLYWVFPPRWETNDDVAMSMIAHGYGMASSGSPDLVFSNVLWGYLVRSLPAIGAIKGYTLATLVSLLCVCWSVLYFTTRLTDTRWLGLSCVALVLFKPLVVPQFTVTAGLMAVSAVLAWLTYAREPKKVFLLIGCAFAFAAFLVRSLEFAVVMFIAIPLIPWRFVRTDRAVQLALASLVTLIGVAILLDYFAYLGPEWKSFNGFNLVRIAFTDYGVGEVIKRHPDVMTRYGYTANDIDLLTNWFFVDPAIADPNALKAMITEVGGAAIRGGFLQNGWRGIAAFWDSALWPLSLGACLLLVCRPSLKILTTVALAVLVVFAIGVAGRPGVARIYVPIIGFVMVMQTIACASSARIKLVAGVALMCAVVLNCWQAVPEINKLNGLGKIVRERVHDFPKETVVVWTFNVELTHPVLAAAPPFSLYALGTFTNAPFSVSYSEARAGRSVINRLLSEHGVLIAGNAQQFEMLRLYCAERLNGSLVEMSSRDYEFFLLNRYRCARP